MQSPSSSFSYGFTYQVFLSFRGIDTRYGFTGNLYKALTDKGIHTFIDDCELQRGSEITPSLVKAIEESRFFIPVFSANYASSSFCLDELVHIIQCYKEKGRLVFPVFFGVDPSHVRHHRGSYGEALAEHEKRFQNHKYNMERLQKWKVALTEAANLSGDHCITTSGYEYKFIGKIVKYISKKINRDTLHVANYPVGLQSQVQQVKSLLDNELGHGVHMVGIYGTGGLGKSTLARAIYNFIADQFDGLCFLHNVRENSTQNKLKHLQEKLLLKTIGLNIKLGDVNEGIPIIKQRLRRKKILLILDDVDKLKQLQVLAGGLNWFGPGSRVIITTRDTHILKCHNIERTYALEGLNDDEAHELLRWMAFKNNKFHSSYEDVLNRAVTYASGLPLAIEIVGSNLFGKSTEEWKSTLEGYEKIPTKEIQNILKVSFNALEEEQQNVFLDIACFFKGFSLAEVEYILHAHYGHCIKHHVGVLVDKSLIRISRMDIVRLHDLIEGMGKEIVRQESPKEPGERTRLWFHRDIVHVLKENTGTTNTEIIYLNCPSIEVVIDWNEDAFKKMTNLKTLIIKRANFSKGTRYFPSSLRVFEWQNYPSGCIPCILNKQFENMKVLKFDNCEHLRDISDVSCLPNLKEFSFTECKNLITIHNSIGFLNKLEILNAKGCTKLRSFPPLELPSLKKLELSYCKSLQNFPEILGKIENLEYIHIKKTSIEEIPVSFRNLIGLFSVYIKGHGKLMLPSHIIFNMPNVFMVDVRGYHISLPKQDGNQSSNTLSSSVASLNLTRSNLSYVYLPIFLTWFTNLRHLYLYGSNVRVLPECLKEYPFLYLLQLDHCHYLEDISAIPPNLTSLSALNCKSLNSSSRSMLVNQKLHECGETEFRFPSPRDEMIPEWFEHQSRGGATIPFWFRNKFPSTMFFFSTKSKMKDYEPTLPYTQQVLVIKVNVFINDYKEHGSYPISFVIKDMPPSHTYIFHLQLQKMVELLKARNESKLLSKLNEALLKNEWIHVELTLKFERHLHFKDGEDEISTLNGIHVMKEKNNMEDIRFTNPHSKRKLDEHLNTSPSQFHPLLKKQRLEVEVLETKLVELEHRMDLLSLQ